MCSRKVKIESRNEQFTTKIKSNITFEKPSVENEFLAQEVRIHGYNVLNLMDESDYLDVFFLLFSTELPTKEQKVILTKLAVLIINLGPRHTSSRAAANAGIGRTDVNHILPIANMALSGAYGGAKEVENAMCFLKKSFSLLQGDVAKQCLSSTYKEKGDWIVEAGFGSDFGGQSPFLLAAKNKMLAVSPKDGYLNWANEFVNSLSVNKNCGWRLAGLVAGVLLDLNFTPRVGAGIFQLLASSGAFAHGIQFANKPITEIPFLKDENYEIKND